MSTKTASFSGFSSPNYTMVPDQLFDELMTELSGSELKVLLYIIRRTYGFKRDADAISLSQMLEGITTHDGRVLDRGAGLSKPSLLSALRSLIEKRIIVAQRQQTSQSGNQPTIYRLHMHGEKKQKTAPVQEKPTPLVKKVYQAPLVKKFDQPLVKKVTPQYTVIQNTDISNIRNSSKSTEKTVTNDDVYADTTLVVEEVKAPSHPCADDIRPSQTDTPQRASNPVQQHASVKRVERDRILKRIEQFALEFGDNATLKASASRAFNLFERSGLTPEGFESTLWEARSITRERLSAKSGQPIKSRMGYFFSVLAERLGLSNEGGTHVYQTA